MFTVLLLYEDGFWATVHVHPKFLTGTFVLNIFLYE